MYKAAFPDMTLVAHPEVISGVKKVIINKWMPEEVVEDAIQVKIMPKVNQAFSGLASSVTSLQGPRVARSSTPGPRS